MKKTVTIVTIPLGKESIPKNSIVKCVSEFSNVIKVGDIFIVDCSIDKQDDEYKSLEAQQLLVLSDDEILEGDFCTLLDGFGNVILGNPQKYNPDEGHVLNKGLKKTIAAYPTIDGVLPISRETIQEWIDSGTPKEGVVEFELVRPCDLRDDQPEKEDKLFTSFKINPKGNVLLEFSEPIKPEKKADILIQSSKGESIEEVAEEYGHSKSYYPDVIKEYYDAFKAGAKWKEKQLADEAIEFANWLINKKYIIHKDHWMRIEDGEIKYYSSEQLYEIWNSRK